MRTKWGRWTFNAETRSLGLLDEMSPMYCCIPLTMCNSPAEILDWIVQVHERTWTGPLDVSSLVEALNDLLDLQRNYCGAGIDRSSGCNGYSTKILQGRLELLLHQAGGKGSLRE